MPCLFQTTAEPHNSAAKILHLCNKGGLGDTECAKRSWRQIDGESPLLGKG